MTRTATRRLAAFAATLFLLAAPAHAVRVSIAAVVGDDIITTSDVESRRDLVMATAGIPLTIENQQKITPRIIQSLVDETLQMQEAKRNSITVTDAEVSKAVENMGQEDGQTMRDFIKKRGLSQASLDSQLRAQMAWNKVVQRKLRRNVIISEDELQRAKAAQAASPGEQELRINAIELIINGADKEPAMRKLADELALQLKADSDMAALASRYIRRSEVQYKPPVWIAESRLPPAIQQALHTVKTGESTAPLRGADTIQILQVLDRRTIEKQASNTEFAVKQIAIAVPKKQDKTTSKKLSDAAKTLRSNPGDCVSETITKVNFPTEVKFVRTTFGTMSPQQRQIVGRLEVGEVSEPLLAPDAVRLVMLCEKIEPTAGMPDVEKLRQELFAEKIELEAQKHLRNLRRDAFIDIKGVQ